MPYDQAPTVMVVDPDNAADYIVIAQETYDATVHRLWEDSQTEAGDAVQDTAPPKRGTK